MREPILFLHPVGGTYAYWRPQISHFAGSVAIDLTADTLEGMADQAARHGPAHVVGLSMGGVVALELWRRRPDRVRSLTLACTWAKHPEAASRIAFLEEQLSRMTLREFAAQSRPFLLAPETSEETAGKLFEMEASKDAGLYRRQWRAIFSADLSGIVPTVPTLLIGASLDRLSPVDSCLRPLQHQIPESRLVVLDGANHFANWDRPAEFNRIVSEFLDSRGKP